eukprot:TRINITY_DN5126_c0_g7_i1.p1 TRINITY_DN5126_c0_g7~~TRINITY_DN5126_c0_g7_i1.p1  ORF type:complete len:150 (-),score=14.65 TRINITY_DN5126_c0_g7_i1:80-529(-)
MAHEIIDDWPAHQVSFLSNYHLSLSQIQFVENKLENFRQQIGSLQLQSQSVIRPLDTFVFQRQVDELQTELSNFYREVDKFRYLAQLPRAMIPHVELDQQQLLENHTRFETEFQALKNLLEPHCTKNFELCTFDREVYVSSLHSGSQSS